MTCAFCTPENVVYRTMLENEFAIGFPSNLPITLGHTLIVPKRHVQIFDDLTKEEREAIEELRKSARQALTKVFSAEGFNYAWNEGAVAGQSVPHVHLHVVPRKPGDTGRHGQEPRAFLYRPGSRAESPKAELAEVARLIRATLA